MTEELAKRINELEADVETLASNWVQTERELEEAKEEIKRLEREVAFKTQELGKYILRAAEAEDAPRAIHAAFCAGIRYMNGNRELTSHELAEARKYTDQRIALDAMQ